MSSPDNHRRLPGSLPFIPSAPPPPPPRSPQPLSAVSSSVAHHNAHTRAHDNPTMADSAAAYWHGRATASASFAAALPSSK
mmetsp:Transcript_26410/g.56734  ORF Transcript_26410/g.56734 Transcript_26410/m.56734 type:complete len:81 (+) Transcript_26410:376-618(+)